MARRPLAAVLTLGCKLNLADSEQIARGLRGAGYDVVDRVCEADAYVVNTCSVTHVADAKSRRLIRSVRRLAPTAAVTVTGCYPQSAGFDAVESLGADLVVGMRDPDKARLIDYLAARADQPQAMTEVPATFGPQARPGHARAFIKAQEGCNDVCAFCIVPQTRGREASRSIETVAAEISAAVETGAKEAVVTGTQLGAWGRDLDPMLTPAQLISGILERTDIARIRFSSLQPQDITPELLALWRDPRLMPHFHLALQSGSDEVLRAMRRRYTVAQFRAAAGRIRAAVPAAAITTDIIAGFPGESEANFDATLAFCAEMGFERLHCFPYSKRARTNAALLTGHLPHEVIHERMERLLALAAELFDHARTAARGQVRPVLWEHERKIGDDVLWVGHTDTYLPVFAPGKALRNRITPVYLGALYDKGVRGYSPGEML
ncbi:MAG: MiaB/RimO family radical SAM methylthiotransferase [Tepidiformaceae bacterium]